MLYKFKFKGKHLYRDVFGFISQVYMTKFLKCSIVLKCDWVFLP